MSRYFSNTKFVDTYSRTVAGEWNCIRYRIVALVRFSDLGIFFAFFDEACKEHEFLFVISCVKVMKLQTHVLQNCTKQTFTLMTFRKIKFKIIVTDTSCAEMSFCEATLFLLRFSIV